MVRIVIDEQDFKEKLNKAMKGIAFDFQESFKRKLTQQHGKDVGDLQGSIKGKVEGTTINFRMAEQGEYVEYGTPPHWPPFDPNEKSFPDLYGWVRRKWGKGSRDGDKENKQAVFLLARHISRFGTKPFPFLRTTFDFEFGDIVRKNLKLAFK